MKFKTNFNLDNFPAPIGEVHTGVSQTIPDQAMSTREIMNRFARGLPLNVGKNFTYDSDDENTDDPLATVDFKRLDLAEREQLINQIQNARDEAKKRYDDAVKRQKKFSRLPKVLETTPTNVEDIDHDDMGNTYENSDSTVERRPGTPPAAGGKQKGSKKNGSQH